MPLQNIDSLLQPISPDAPCGPDLEYDPAFLELDRISEGKPEQQMGDTIVAAQEPDWKDVSDRTQALLTKTKDLRVAIRLTRALLNIDGFAGLADGLTVMRGIVENYWDGFYPKLDPDDDNDPTFRVNILMGLCDLTMFIDRIRTTPVVSAKILRPIQSARFRHCLGRAASAPGYRTAQDIRHRRRLQRMPPAGVASPGGFASFGHRQSNGHRDLRGRQGRGGKRNQLRKTV